MSAIYNMLCQLKPKRGQLHQRKVHSTLAVWDLLGCKPPKLCVEPDDSTGGTACESHVDDDGRRSSAWKHN